MDCGIQEDKAKRVAEPADRVHRYTDFSIFTFLKVRQISTS
jgi:hypothetical protein